MATATFNQIINFPAATAAGQDATVAVIYDAITGGNQLGQRAFDNNPDPLDLNGAYRVLADEIVFEYAPGDNFTEEMARRALRGQIAGTLYLGLHTGTLASLGAELSGSGYARQPMAQAGWTVA